MKSSLFWHVTRRTLVPTFRDRLSVPSSRLITPNWSDCLNLKMELIFRPETSVTTNLRCVMYRKCEESFILRRKPPIPHYVSCLGLVSLNFSRIILTHSCGVSSSYTGELLKCLEVPLTISFQIHHIAIERWKIILRVSCGLYCICFNIGSKILLGQHTRCKQFNFRRSESTKSTFIR
jgi:hypothetical protein